jgi:hypothetical protein
MTSSARIPLALAAALLLALLAVAGPGQEEPTPPPGETDPGETAREETAAPGLETPVTLETLAARVETLERIVLGARAGEGVVSPRAQLPGDDPTQRRVADLERRLQRLELGASTPAGGLGQVESRLRQVESRLSRLESDLRTLRR